jgi:hypothetical protein
MGNKLRSRSALIPLALWSAVTALGVALVGGVSDQQAPGYPNLAQAIYYVGAPGLLASAALLTALFAGKNGGRLLAFVLLLPGLILFFGFTGGV